MKIKPIYVVAYADDTTGPTRDYLYRTYHTAVKKAAKLNQRDDTDKWRVLVSVEWLDIKYLGGKEG